MSGRPRPVTSVQGWIDRRVPLKTSRARDVPLSRELAPEVLGDKREEVVGICERIGRDGRGELFGRLYHEGDWSFDYPSASEAEIDLLDLLAWATRYVVADEDERHSVIGSVFEASAFCRTNHRPQWDREGYLDGQIGEAMDCCTSGYTGKPKEQTLGRLEAFRIERSWGREMNLCAMYAAHIALAHDHGRYARSGESVLGPSGEIYKVPETGVLVHSSARDLSLFSGVSPTVAVTDDGTSTRDYRNVTKLNDGLEDAGLIRRIHRGVSWGVASLYLLPEPLLDGLGFSPMTHKREPHPSPLTQTSTEHNSVYKKTLSGLCVMGEKLLLTEKLNRMPRGVLTPRQRFVVEQAAWGRDTFEELLEYFRGDPRHLRYKVIGPLLKGGLLVGAGGTYAVDIEAVEELFVRSGGEELLRAEMEAVEDERARQRLGDPALTVEDPEDADDWPQGWGWYADGDPMLEAIAKSSTLMDFEDPDDPGSA